MKQIILLICCLLNTASELYTMIQPKVAAAPTFDPITYKIHIVNTSNMPATLNGITIQYTPTNQPSITPMPMVTATTNITIAANKGISFVAKASSPVANVGIKFQGITKLTINSQQIILATPSMGISPIYIENTNNVWKITTKPVAKKAPSIVPAPVIAKKDLIDSATVPYIQETHPALSITSKTVPAIAQEPKAMVTAKTSIATTSATKAINATLAKTA